MLYNHLIESHVRENRIALTIGEKDYTYRELDSEIKKALSAMDELGIRCGDRVLISCDNDLETVLLILTCIAAGIAIIPIDHNVGVRQYHSIVENCSPKIIFCSHRDLEKWRYKQIPLFDKSEIVFKWNETEKDQYGGSSAPRRQVDSSCIGYIIYTSGSDGYPKGVVARYRQILFCIDKINKALKHVRDDRILSSLPLSFDYGLYQVFLTFSAGAHLYLIPGHQFQTIPGMLVKHNITGWPGMPFLFRLLLKTKMLERIRTPDLRYITSTGDVFPVVMINALEDIFPHTYIIPMYGLTECKRVSIMPMDPVILCQKKGSCGIPLPETKVYLRNVQPETGIGELVICGPNVMDGYWNAPDETKQYFVLNDEGNNTLYSGDLFWIDGDGYLYFKGREKRILKLRGYRISCTEIEDMLGAIEGVIESRVFDYQSEDDVRICVCIVSAKNGVEDEVRRRLKDCYPTMRNIEVRVYREPFPRNANGKIDMNRLKKDSGQYDL